MLALEIIRLKIVVNTYEQKTFQTKIPFSKGLNVIRAENTSGKSTCVNAIAYAMGLESILGPLKSKPFPKSLYEYILDSKDNGKVYNVSSSYVELTIKNNIGKKVVLKRYIRGDSKFISVNENNETQDYFLDHYGSLGSSKSEYGFHNWLEKFMMWDLPFVPNLTGGKTKLYLETIFPLFFIEQKRGWSEIQANVPNNYGIKNVKRSAIEYVLDISDFETENKINSYRKIIDNLSQQWDFIDKNIQSLCEISNINFSGLSKIGNQVFPLEFYASNVDAAISIHNFKLALIQDLNNLEASISTNFDEEILNYKSIIIKQSDTLSNLENHKQQLQIIVYDLNKKIDIIYSDLEKYKQLKLLSDLGSENIGDLKIEKCPICNSNLNDNLHIDHSTQTKPMSLQENIDFLNEQWIFFKNMKNKHLNEISEQEKSILKLKNNLKLNQQKLFNLENDSNASYSEMRHNIRQKIEKEQKLNEIQIFLEKVKDLEENLNKNQLKWQSTNNALTQLLSKSQKTKAEEVLTKLESIMQKNLNNFGFTESSINQITISRLTYRPEQNGYDIIAETSASDYIRIIWAYTLAILELAQDLEVNVQHCGFIVFDEPRQHEAKAQSLYDLIMNTALTFNKSGQAIFTTSFENFKEVSLIDFDNINLIYFNDNEFILH